MRNTLFSIVVAAAAALSAPVLADGWTLAPDQSKIAFGSIKKNVIGEVHNFTNLSGTVAADGAAKIQINVKSLQTWIDIRNERMLEHVFKAVNFPAATIEAKIDMKALAKLQPGQSTVVSTELVLALAGAELELDADLFVMAISDDRVMVTTDEMIMVTTEELEIDAAVDKLQELADLPSITRAVPVTLRLVFVKG